MLGGRTRLVSAIEEAFFFHAIARRAPTRFEIKGFAPLTEHYSVLGRRSARKPRGASASATRRSWSTCAASTRCSSQGRRRAMRRLDGRDLLDDAPDVARGSTSSRTALARRRSGVVDYTTTPITRSRVRRAGAHVVRSTER
jgi:hypothetical protein